VVRNGAVADGVQIDSVKVKVTDAYGHQLDGQPIELKADNGVVVGTINPTNTDGEVMVTLTSTVSGHSTIKASITNSKGQISSQEAKVNFLLKVVS